MSDTDTLTALANAIIPPDGRDAGAGAVKAGPRLAERMQGGPQAQLYVDGVRTVEDVARRVFERPVRELSPAELHHLLTEVRDRAPAFFKQLRLDVCAMYLSDPAVLQRIGFPGPSIESGGYPDFDQPQDETAGRTS